MFAPFIGTLLMEVALVSAFSKRAKVFVGVNCPLREVNGRYLEERFGVCSLL
jgi:hypothetical protein